MDRNLEIKKKRYWGLAVFSVLWLLLHMILGAVGVAGVMWAWVTWYAVKGDASGIAGLAKVVFWLQLIVGGITFIWLSNDPSAQTYLGSPGHFLILIGIPTGIWFAVYYWAKGEVQRIEASEASSKNTPGTQHHDTAHEAVLSSKMRSSDQASNSAPTTIDKSPNETGSKPVVSSGKQRPVPSDRSRAKPMIDEGTERPSIDQSDDAEVYLRAMEELDNDKPVKALWAKAVTLCEGDKEKARYLYIKTRVEELKREAIEEAKAEAERIATAKAWEKVVAEVEAKKAEVEAEARAEAEAEAAARAKVQGKVQLEKGVSAYHSGAYSIAYAILLPFAVHGNADAQYILGRMHWIGQGVAYDLQEARKWFKLAAKQGHTDSIMALRRFIAR